MAEEFSWEIGKVNEVPNYDDFYCRLQVQKYGREYEIKAMLDPHPSPDEAYAFVCEHIFQGHEHETLSEMMPTLLENYDDMTDWIYDQEDIWKATNQTPTWKHDPRGIKDIDWALGTDEYREKNWS